MHRAEKHALSLKPNTALHHRLPVAQAVEASFYLQNRLKITSHLVFKSEKLLSNPNIRFQCSATAQYS